MRNKSFFLYSKNMEQKTLLWNFISSMLFGFQSVVMLIVLTRTVGLEVSGVFTIAYANASLFLLIGKYGVRNYQVSDVSMEYTFGDYKTVRFITTVTMLVVSAGYLLYRLTAGNYSVSKSIVILFTCLYKVPDSVEDVYFGEYQRHGRLDVAAKIMSVRLGFSILLFVIVVIITRNLMAALVISIVTSSIILYGLLKKTAVRFCLNNHVKRKHILEIIKDCFPLFAGSFLLQYINNAPKYAIDVQLSDDLQACYGFLSMPVFVISLLSNVIFGPLIHKMAGYWDRGERKQFVRHIFIQVCIITGIMFLCLAGAYIWGISVLSFLYHTDLSDYKNELMILLIGGGFLSLAGFLNIIMTIMRSQFALLGGYVVVSIIALLCSKQVVKFYGILGASCLYTGLMVILFLIFLFLFFIVYNHNRG